MNNEEFQNLVLKKLDNIDKRFDKVDTDVKDLKSNVEDLKNGQTKILDMLRNLEAQNADRHLQIERKLSVLEEVTVNNWTDIIKLKKVK